MRIRISLEFDVIDEASLREQADAAIEAYGAGVRRDHPTAPLAHRAVELLLHSNPAVASYNDMGLEFTSQTIEDVTDL